jgi:hypothetical protein
MQAGATHFVRNGNEQSTLRRLRLFLEKAPWNLIYTSTASRQQLLSICYLPDLDYREARNTPWFNAIHGPVYERGGFIERQ